MDRARSLEGRLLAVERRQVAEQENVRGETADARSYYEDLLWSLMNSKQFLFVR